VTPILPDDDSPRFVFARPGLVLVLIALLVRCGWLGLTWTSPLVGDEIDYHIRAQRHALGDVRMFKYPGLRPPVTEVVYGTIYDEHGPRPIGPRLWNVLMGSLLVLPVAAIGNRFGGRRVAWMAGLGAAAFPELVFFSTSLWSEPTYLLLSTTALALILEPDRPRWRWTVAGLAFGVAALTREVGLLVPLAVAPTLVWIERARWRPALARSALLLVGFVLVVGPWSAWASQVNGERVGITLTTWFNVYIGNAIDPEVAKENYERLGDFPAERERRARVLALRDIRERMPAWPFEKIVDVVPAMVGPNSFPLGRLLDERHLLTFSWSALDAGGVRMTLAVLTILASYALLSLGAVGLILPPRPGPALLFAVIIAALWVGPLVTFGLSRFRLAFVPLFVVAAAGLVVAPRIRWDEASRTRRGVALGVVLVLTVVFVSQVPGVLLDPTWG